MQVVADLPSWQVILAVVLPVIISGLKYVVPQLNGAQAFWANLAINFLAGIGAALQTGEPTAALAAGPLALGGTGLFELGKRTGVAGRKKD